ncbi:MAG: hypothetical protein KDD61_14955, partial [Bdellovibrionales bacterium]|nr:hypothetical protein [Bdellovibrionales bacterium]
MIQFSKNHCHDNDLLKDLQSTLHKMISEKEWGFSRVPHQEETWAIAAKVGQRLRSEFDHLVVIGMGGSSLGAKAIVEALRPQAPITFWNSSDPETIQRSIKARKDLRKTHWLVISKSGTTLETMALMNLAAQAIDRAGLNLMEHMSLITEEKSSPLYDFAQTLNMPIYPHPIEVGGRFSVFTLVGMIPAAFAGIDVKELRMGALEIEKNEDLIAQLATTALLSFQKQQWSTVLWPYYDRLKSFSDWLVQLWSESLGKSVTRNGQPAPQASYPSHCLGARDQHSILQQFAEGEKDKWILFFKVMDHQVETLRFTEKGKVYPPLLHNLDLNTICNIQADATYESLLEGGASVDCLTFERLG